VLEEAVDSPRADGALSLRAIEAGLAYYPPRSFANPPAFGFLDILRPNPGLAVGEEHRVGQLVVGTLWELRQDVAPHLLDRAYADAWLGRRLPTRRRRRRSVLGWVIGWSSAPATPRCAPGRWRWPWWPGAVRRVEGSLTLREVERVHGRERHRSVTGGPQGSRSTRRG
jgi:hypothetical protein